MAKESTQHFEEQNNAGDEKKFSKMELKGLEERLRVIIRTVSGKKDLEVTTDVDPETLFKMALQGMDAHDEWYTNEHYDPKARKRLKLWVHVPRTIIEVSENAAKGKAAHEGGHVAIGSTRAGEFVPDEVLQELGFHGVLAAVEERPTDQVVRDRFSGGGEWVDEARSTGAEEETALAKSKKTLGYVPKSVQLETFCVYAPHYKEIPAHYDPEVIACYDRIKPHVEEVEKTLPREKAGEEEILEKAKERYKITYTKIWPEAKKFVKKDEKTETLRQMLERAIRQSKANAPPEKDSDTGETLENIMGRLSEELAHELADAIANAMEKKTAEVPPPVAEENGGGEIPHRNEEEKTETPADDELPSEGTPSDTEKQPQPIPLPMDQLSGPLIRALQEIFDRMPEERKKKLRYLAKKMLEKIEDAIVQAFSGKIDTEHRTETHTEYDARLKEEEEEKKKSKERQRIKKEEEKKVTEELEEIERKQAALRKDRKIYDTTYEEIRALDEELYQTLEEIFTPNVKAKMRLKSSGNKINLPAVFRWEAGRGAGGASPDSRIFESLHIPEKKDYAITILNDLSASMRAKGKIEQDFKAKILLAEVFNRLGIAFELLGFQDEVIIFKRFEEDMNDDVRTRISGMIDEVWNNNPEGHNQAGWNDDGPCLLDASRGLGKQPGKEKFLLVLSDGQPAGKHSTKEDLTRAVKHILTTTDQKLIALGLGPDTEHVKNYYPTSLPNINIQELPKTFVPLVEDMIIHPEHYAYTPN